MLQNANLSACALDHKTYYHFSVEKYLPDYIPLKQELSLDKGSITVLLGTSGVGKTSLINACIDETKDLGIKRVFALTYVPEFFEKFGFKRVNKSYLPRKVWGECLSCVKFPDCSEIPLIKEL